LDIQEDAVRAGFGQDVVVFVRSMERAVAHQGVGIAAPDGVCARIEPRFAKLQDIVSVVARDIDGDVQRVGEVDLGDSRTISSLDVVMNGVRQDDVLADAGQGRTLCGDLEGRAVFDVQAVASGLADGVHVCASSGNGDGVGQGVWVGILDGMARGIDPDLASLQKLIVIVSAHIAHGRGQGIGDDNAADRGTVAGRVDLERGGGKRDVGQRDGIDDRIAQPGSERPSLGWWGNVPRSCCGCPNW
jgi:hypothetical protein